MPSAMVDDIVNGPMRPLTGRSMARSALLTILSQRPPPSATWDCRRTIGQNRVWRATTSSAVA